MVKARSEFADVKVTVRMDAWLPCAVVCLSWAWSSLQNRAPENEKMRDRKDEILLGCATLVMGVVLVALIWSVSVY